MLSMHRPPGAPPPHVGRDAAVDRVAQLFQHSQGARADAEAAGPERCGRIAHAVLERLGQAAQLFELDLGREVALKRDCLRGPQVHAGPNELAMQVRPQLDPVIEGAEKSDTPVVQEDLWAQQVGRLDAPPVEYGLQPAGHALEHVAESQRLADPPPGPLVAFGVDGDGEGYPGLAAMGTSGHRRERIPGRARLPTDVFRTRAVGTIGTSRGATRAPSNPVFEKRYKSPIHMILSPHRKPEISPGDLRPFGFVLGLAPHHIECGSFAKARENLPIIDAKIVRHGHYDGKFGRLRFKIAVPQLPFLRHW